MKTLNDDTIKQLGNGIIDKIGGKYNTYFRGIYNTATGEVKFGDALYNRVGRFAVHVGDCIIVAHQGITEPVYYDGTFNINFDTNTPYTGFTVLEANMNSNGSIYIDAFDKAGNKVSINSINGDTFSIRLKEPIIPITWNHTTWESINKIKSLVLDSNFLKFKEGDKIKFGSADEGFFNATTVEIKKLVVSDNPSINNFSFEIVLAKDFGYSEEVQITCNGSLARSSSGTVSYTEKQRRITTNCPTYILGTMNDSDINDCTSIILPKGEITIDAQLYSEYLPKVGDIVCARNSPTITDYGFYTATIEYIQTTDTPAPYAILRAVEATFPKYYLTDSAFVTTLNTK